MSNITQEELQNILNSDKKLIEEYNSGNDDIFEKFHDLVRFCEFDVNLCFDDPYQTESSVNDFLVHLGFRSSDDGFQYLQYLLTECVNSTVVPTRMVNVYKFCGEHYNASVKSVEMAITNAIKNASNSSNLSKLNDFFRCNVIVDNRISNSEFISYVTNRFILQKRYKQRLCLKIDSNSQN